jgi:glycosyltransferase involved in cell wall biosynthesis
LNPARHEKRPAPALKIIAISRVKVEADILEAFVRHNSSFVDLMLVMDDASTDGSLAILNALAAEGLNLIISKGEPGTSHRDALMELLSRAFHAHGADWVLPLDSDEFIELNGIQSLHDRLPASSDLPHSVLWHPFVYRREAAVPGLPPILAELPYRVSPREPLTKVMIPKMLALKTGFSLQDGSHEAALDGETLPRVAVPEIALCHFPIRSVEQYSKKTVLGRWLSIMTRGNHTAHAYHYWAPYEALKDGNGEFEQIMFEQSLNYSDEPVHTADDVYFEPLRYQGGACRYQGKIIKTSLHHDMCVLAETMASHLFLRGLSPEQISALQPVKTELSSVRLLMHRVVPPNIRRALRAAIGRAH